MALIGTMKYLTIGNQTYEIAGDELQIASASTLGGIKVGNGLSIDATTGVLSTSITESDPVFSASAAAGITTTNISNWNSKVNKTGDTMTGTLIVGSDDYVKKIEITYNKINFYDASGDNYITLKGRNGDYSTNYSISLPTETGTIALTSDIKGLTFAMDTTDTKKLNITYS